MTSPKLKAIEPLLAELTPGEMRELADELIQRADPPEDKPKTIDWELYRGILKHGPDGVEYQRAVRAEWD